MLRRRTRVDAGGLCSLRCLKNGKFPTHLSLEPILQRKILHINIYRSAKLNMKKHKPFRCQDIEGRSTYPASFAYRLFNFLCL